MATAIVAQNEKSRSGVRLQASPNGDETRVSRLHYTGSAVPFSSIPLDADGWPDVDSWGEWDAECEELVGCLAPVVETAHDRRRRLHAQVRAAQQRVAVSILESDPDLTMEEIGQVMGVCGRTARRYLFGESRHHPRPR